MHWVDANPILVMMAFLYVIMIPFNFLMFGQLHATTFVEGKVQRPALPLRRRILASLLGFLAFFKCLRRANFEDFPASKPDSTVGAFEGIFVDGYRYIVRKQRPWPTHSR